MQKEFFEELSKFSTNTMKPFAALNTITSHAIESFTKNNIDVINDAFVSGMANIQSFANTKKVEDVVALQTQILKDSGSKAISYAQKSLDTLVDTSTAFSKWMEEGVSTFSKNIKDITDKKTGGNK